jgi:hypothetical protein
MKPEPDILDDLFLGCALEAFVTVSRECGGWPPSERVRQLAYRLYEKELVERNVAKQPTTERTRL